MVMLALSLLAATAMEPRAAGPALSRSDVVFMYQADRQTYADYGATVLAWGGKPDARALAEAKGVRWLGSVGMVTEFNRYHDRFPETYAEALCRDIDGKPVKVPWLTDHQHKGIPYWWCCTNQPRFRTYLRERVTETIKAGAEGLHVDDHMGTSGGLWLGVCFCDRCVEGFRGYLAAQPPDRRGALAKADAAAFDFRADVRAWLAAAPGRQPTQHPAWPVWTAYQCKAAAALMAELRATAEAVAGKPVPVGANAGLLWPLHLADFKVLDLFSAETDHHAAGRKPSDAPILAYRLADAVGRPYAATASGQDWAYVQEKQLHGLVRHWIALGYAAGHRLMAPHRQWCYTPEKGTHWYQGPAERFAPLYRFVRENAGLFDGYEAYADMDLLMPHRSFRNGPQPWIDAASRLTAANVAFRLVLAGDEIVDKPLVAADLSSRRPLVAPHREKLDPADGRLLERRARRGGVYDAVDAAMAALHPAAKAVAPGPVRAFPRVKRGSALVHLVSYAYDGKADDVTPQANVTLTLDLKALGVPSAREARVYAPGCEPQILPVRDGRVVVPTLGLWAIVALGEP
ncbi:MAG: hypothetical protein NT029_20355 [Armatimonadetes bacterium]|nr:hypothetical protein [Armatimonadota bacterium]